MSTAATERGRRTAQRLRGAAREVFADVGYVNARVEDIVTRADVSHGTFYTHYQNKGAVLEALVRETVARLNEVVEAPWQGGDRRSTLEGVIGDFLEVYLAETDVIATWVEAAAIEAEFAALLAEIRGGFVQRVARNVAPLTEVGGHDARIASQALVAMVEGFVTAHPDEVRRGGGTIAPTLAAIWHGGLQALASADPARRVPAPNRAVEDPTA